jgi:hypothetical protein
LVPRPIATGENENEKQYIWSSDSRKYTVELPESNFRTPAGYLYACCTVARADSGVVARVLVCAYWRSTDTGSGTASAVHCQTSLRIKDHIEAKLWIWYIHGCEEEIEQKIAINGETILGLLWMLSVIVVRDTLNVNANI